MNIKDLSKISMRNRELIENSKHCACYYCLSKFEPKEIKHWIDNEKTAMCPKCKIDSVIADNSPIEDSFLREANDYWF